MTRIVPLGPLDPMPPGMNVLLTIHQRPQMNGFAVATLAHRTYACDAPPTPEEITALKPADYHSHLTQQRVDGRWRTLEDQCL